MSTIINIINIIINTHSCLFLFEPSDLWLSAGGRVEKSESIKMDQHVAIFWSF